MGIIYCSIRKNRPCLYHRSNIGSETVTALAMVFFVKVVHHFLDRRHHQGGDNVVMGFIDM